jgi:hypothetical protein
MRLFQSKAWWFFICPALVILTILAVVGCSPATGRHSLVLRTGATTSGVRTGRIVTPPNSPIHILYVDGFPGPNLNPLGSAYPKTFTGGVPAFTDIAVRAGRHEVIFACALNKSKGLSPLQVLLVDMEGGEIITIRPNPDVAPKALDTCDVLVHSNIRGIIKGALKEFAPKKE